MMLEAPHGELGIDIVGRVLESSAGYVAPTTLPDRGDIEPFVDVARRYGSAPDDVLIRAAGGRSSMELSTAVLGNAGAAAREPYRWLVLAQDSGDRLGTLAPLARVHAESALDCAGHFGLTHLDANAAVDGLGLLAWLLSPGEQALLVLTDQPILAPRRAAPGRLPRGEGSVALRACRGAGRLRLIATGRARWPEDAFSSPARFADRLAGDRATIGLANATWTADHVVAQNVFASVPGTPPEGGRLAGSDFGSGDVWHRLDTLLADGAVGVGERVLLAAVGGARRVSYALLEVGPIQEQAL